MPPKQVSATKGTPHAKITPTTPATRPATVQESASSPSGKGKPTPETHECPARQLFFDEDSDGSPTESTSSEDSLVEELVMMEEALGMESRAPDSLAPDDSWLDASLALMDRYSGSQWRGAMTTIPRPATAPRRPDLTSELLGAIPNYSLHECMDYSTLLRLIDTVDAAVTSAEESTGVCFNRRLVAVASDHFIQRPSTPFECHREEIAALLRAQWEQGYHTVFVPVWMRNARGNVEHFVTVTLHRTSPTSRVELSYHENMRPDHTALNGTIEFIRQVAETAAPVRRRFGAVMSLTEISNSCGACVINDYLHLRLGNPMIQVLSIPPHRLTSTRATWLAANELAKAKAVSKMSAPTSLPPPPAPTAPKSKALPPPPAPTAPKSKALPPPPAPTAPKSKALPPPPAPTAPKSKALPPPPAPTAASPSPLAPVPAIGSVSKRAMKRPRTDPEPNLTDAEALSPGIEIVGCDPKQRKKKKKKEPEGHEVYPAPPPAPVARCRTRTQWQAVTAELFDVRHRLQGELANYKYLNAYLLCRLKHRMQTIKTLRKDRNRLARKLKESEARRSQAVVEPPTKRRRGRPAKKTARKHVHFHVDLRGRQIAQWGDGGNFISVVRYLARCVMGTQKFDIRSMTELRQTLGIPYDTLMKVVNAPNVADLLVLKERKKSKQEVVADEKRDHVRLLVEKACQEDVYMTTTQVIDYVVKNAPFEISVPHAYRLVSQDSGFKFKMGRTVPFHKPEDKATRKAFCELWRDKPQSERDRLVFSDETYFSEQLPKKGTWCRPDEEPAPFPKKTKPASQMLWISIGKFADGKWISAHVWYKKGTTQDAKTYTKVLTAAFLPMAQETLAKEGRKLLLMHDGATCHKAPIAAAWLTEHSGTFDVLEGWPPRSPDLNPIENLFGWFKTRLAKVLPPQERNIARIKSEVLKLINDPDTQRIAKRQWESFHTRCLKCIDVQGAPTKY